MSTTTKVRAVGYCRISRDDQAEGLGVARQSDDVTAYADRKGWSLLEVLADNDFSASEYARKARPGYVRLVEMITAGAVNTVVVYNLDRLLRRPDELETLIALVRERPDVRIYSLGGDIDLSTEEGRFTARILVSVAAKEADATHRRVCRHLEAKAATGMPKGTGKARPFGYETDGVTIREVEAELLRTAVLDVLRRGRSVARIAREWQEAGVPCPQGGRGWRHQTVQSLLTNPRHAGWRVHRGVPVTRGQWEPIITDEQHEQLKAKLKPTPRARRPRGKASALAGIVTTVGGGSRLRRSTGRQGVVYWRTFPQFPGEVVEGRTSIPGDVLEPHVLDLLYAAHDDGRLARRLKEREERNRTLRALSADDPTELQGQLEQLAADFGAGDLTRGEWQAAKGPLSARLEAALKAREAADDHAAPLAMAVGCRLRDVFPTLDADGQRAILTAVFERVEIAPVDAAPEAADRIHPVWRV